MVLLEHDTKNIIDHFYKTSDIRTLGMGLL